MGLGELIVLARRMACREVQVKSVTRPSGLTARDGWQSGDLSALGVENFHVGRCGGQFAEALHKVPAGGQIEVRKQGGHVGPVFDEDEARRVFAIDMDVVSNTAGFGAGPGDVFQAEVEDSVVRIRRRPNTPDNDDHLDISSGRWPIRGQDRLSA
jgi:hypothetical protein